MAIRLRGAGHEVCIFWDLLLDQTVFPDSCSCCDDDDGDFREEIDIAQGFGMGDSDGCRRRV